MISKLTIDDLRRAIGDAANGRSDQEVLAAYADAGGMAPADAAQMFNYDSNTSGKWGNRVRGAIDSFQSDMYGIGEAGGGDWAKRGRVGNEFDSNVARGRAAQQGAVQRWDDVHGVGDFFDYAGGLAIDSAPTMGMIAAGALTGGTASAAMLAGRGLVAAQRAAMIGRTAGGLVGSYGAALGDTLSSQRDEAGRTDLGSAALAAVPYAAVDALTGAGGKVLGLTRRAALEGAESVAGQTAKQAIGDTWQGFTGAVGRTGVNAVKTGASEALGETFQEGWNQYARMGVNPNAELLSPEAQERYKESFIGGGILGAMFGGGLGGWRRSEAWHQKQAADEQARVAADNQANAPTNLLLPYDPTVGNHQNAVFNHEPIYAPQQGAAYVDGVAARVGGIPQFTEGQYSPFDASNERTRALFAPGQMPALTHDPSVSSAINSMVDTVPVRVSPEGQAIGNEQFHKDLLDAYDANQVQQRHNGGLGRPASEADWASWLSNAPSSVTFNGAPAATKIRTDWGAPEGSSAFRTGSTPYTMADLYQPTGLVHGDFIGDDPYQPIYGASVQPAAEQQQTAPAAPAVQTAEQVASQARKLVPPFLKQKGTNKRVNPIIGDGNPAGIAQRMKSAYAKLMEDPTKLETAEAIAAWHQAFTGKSITEGEANGTQAPQAVQTEAQGQQAPSVPVAAAAGQVTQVVPNASTANSLGGNIGTSRAAGSAVAQGSVADTGRVDVTNSVGNQVSTGVASDVGPVAPNANGTAEGGGGALTQPPVKKPRVFTVKKAIAAAAEELKAAQAVESAPSAPTAAPEVEQSAAERRASALAAIKARKASQAAVVPPSVATPVADAAPIGDTPKPLAASEEDRNNAKANAKDLGGEVVWQSGPYALVRGYSALSGGAVYVPTFGARRARKDVDSFTDNLVPAEVLQQMKAAKAEVSAAADRKHAEAPFVKHDSDGLAASSDTSEGLREVVRGWKKLLGLNVPVYLSTIEDATANRNNFTGPHRAIGSGTLDEREDGSVRRMADGSYYVLYRKSSSPTKQLEVIAHELGHLHQRLHYANASPETKAALHEEHSKWLATQKGVSGADFIKALRGRATGRAQGRTTISSMDAASSSTKAYWTSFSEWYADQVSRWAVSDAAPVSVVEKFFARLGAALRRFFSSLKAKRYLPNERFSEYVRNTLLRESDFAGDASTEADRSLGAVGALGTIEPDDAKLYLELAVSQLELGGKRFADFARNMVSDVGEDITPHLRDFYDEAVKLTRANAKTLEVKKDRSGAPLVSIAKRASGEPTTITAEVAKVGKVIARFRDGEWVLDVATMTAKKPDGSSSGVKLSGPDAYLGQTVSDAMSELPYAAAKAHAEYVKQEKATSSVVGASGKRAVSFEPSRAVASNGRVDFAALHEELKDKPQYLKSLYYYMGFDLDGAPLDGGPMGQDAAAREGGWGSNSGANLKTLAGKLGIDQRTISRLAMSELSAPPIEGYEAAPKQKGSVWEEGDYESDVDERRAAMRDDRMRAAEEETRGFGVDDEANFGNEDTADGPQFSGNLEGYQTLSSVSSHGGRGDSQLVNSIADGNRYRRFRDISMAVKDGESLAGFDTAHLVDASFAVSKLILPKYLTRAASSVLRENAEVNEKFMQAVFAELRSREEKARSKKGQKGDAATRAALSQAEAAAKTRLLKNEELAVDTNKAYYDSLEADEAASQADGAPTVEPDLTDSVQAAERMGVVSEAGTNPASSERAYSAREEEDGGGTFSDVERQEDDGLRHSGEDEGAGEVLYRRDLSDGAMRPDYALREKLRGSKNLAQALRVVMATATNQADRALARALLALKGMEQIGFVQTADSLTNPYGFYDPAQRAVTLMGSADAQTLLHEAVHAGTMAALYNGHINPSTGKPISALGRELVALFEKTRQRSNGEYGFTNVDEFLAEAMTNPKFQEALRNDSVWDKFVQWVGKLLGIPKMAMNSLDKTLAISKQLMSENDAALAREDAAQRRGKPARSEGGAPRTTTARDENGQPAYIGRTVELGFAQPVERFEVIPNPGERILNFAVMPKDGFDVLGYVELLMGADGKPKSLLDIEVNDKAGGTGRAVIETILGANPQADLNISNIVQTARGFWERMGVPQQNLEDGAAYDGTLNWNTYAQARDGRPTRRATQAAYGASAGPRSRTDTAAESQARGLASEGVQTGSGLRGKAYSAGGASLHNTPTVSDVERTVQKLPSALRPIAREVARIFQHAKREVLSRVVFTEDLIDMAAAAGIKSAQTYKRLMLDRAKATGHHERRVDAVRRLYDDLPESVKGKGAGTVNQFLHDSTIGEKWGYQPAYLTAKGVNVTVDPQTKAKYDALGAEGQKFVDAVFQLGHDTLNWKKEALTDYVTSEYDAIIKSARTDEERAQAQADKAKALKQFGSLMSLSGNLPYAPIKRFGKYVVIAQSDAYLTADDEARKKMESDESHYFVDFAENDREASSMRDKLRSSGKYAEVDYREKHNDIGEMFGGSSTLAAFERLRAQIDATYSTGPEGEQKRETARKMNTLVTELYLTALAERSARKSELKRRGVSASIGGVTNIDMVRSFESQGKADAHFLGALQTNSDVNASFVQMLKESRTSGVEGSRLFKELNDRHLQSLDYNPSTIAQWAASVTSKMFLATNPAYYAQNATQPWMVSLPVMAGRHGFGNGGSALGKAYSDIAPALKESNVLRGFNFDALLANGYTNLTKEEKAFVQTMLDEGRIDIGLGNELGRNSVDRGAVDSAWGKVDRSLRNMQQYMEAINRVTTAVAAYRLEQDKTKSHSKAAEYADRILRETHGDYSSWNAPRAFNTNFGKIALQFKKYQLIQLTLMAKLMKNSLSDATTDEGKAERSAARKALGMMLSQAFVVGGARALPVPAALAWVFSKMFGDDDEPPEYVVRKMIGDKDTSDLLLSGPLAKMTGANLEKFGGMGNMFSVLPFTDIELSSRQGMASTGFALLSGPAGGLSLRAADGLGAMARGDYWKGVESFLPTGFSNVSKAARGATEGISKTNGDMVMSPDDYGMLNAAMQSVGVQPDAVRRRQYEQNASYDIEQSLTDQSKRIKAEFAKAQRQGNSEAAAQARSDWAALQQRRRDKGFDVRPLSELIKSAQEQAKRERSMVGYMQFDKADRKFKQALAEN